MAQYELAILYDPDLEIDLDKASKKIEAMVTDNGGEIKNTDNWGKRKMAYTIKKQDAAIYVFYTVDLPAEAVKKINDRLNITDEVIRFLITKPDLKKIAKAEEAKAEKARKAAEQVKTEEPETDDADE